MFPLGLLALGIQGAVEPPPLGAPTPLPEPTPVRVLAAERWTIRELPRPTSTSYDTHQSVTVTVRGKRVVFGPKGQDEHLYGVQRGSDDSFLVSRGHTGVGYWSSSQEIWHEGKILAMPYGGASIYRDRLNYAGMHYGEVGISETAPSSYVLRDGKVQELGWGSVGHWQGDAFVLSVPVNELGFPAGDATKMSRVARIVAGGREWLFPEYDFKGASKDGTLTFVSRQAEKMVADGLLGEEARTRTRILTWADGEIVAHVTLPQDWQIVSYAADGSMLARAVHPYDPNANEDWLEKTERDWSAAIVRGDSFTPIRFPRPKGTERLLWRDGAFAFGSHAFRFHAFYDQTDRWFRVARP